jgi:hypothetical protein
MASKSGYAVKVTIGTVTVAGMTSWKMDGVTRALLDDSEFGNEVDKFKYGPANPGKITLGGKYHPADTSGQLLLDSACLNGSVFGSGQIRLYIDSVSYWTIGSGGETLVEKANAIGFDRNGLGMYDATLQCSGAFMRLV